MSIRTTRPGVPVRLALAGTLCFGLLTALPGPVRAQATDPVTPEAERAPMTIPRSPVLVIDSERLFADSAFGQQLADQLEARAAEIAAENRRIEAALAEEERQLTEQRSQMEPGAFRELAAAFDEKVVRIRRERDQEAQGLGQDSEALRRQFLLAVEPVLESLMQDAGSAVILERRAVFVTREVVDITDEAIERIDATLADSAPEAGGQASEAAQGEGEAASDDAPEASEAPAAPQAD